MLASSMCFPLFLALTLQSTVGFFGEKPYLPKYRLVSKFIPLRYKIHLVYSESGYAQPESKVVIKLFCEKEASSILIHANKLTLIKARLFCANHSITLTKRNGPGQTWIFPLQKPILPGDQCNLVIRYKWKVNKNWKRTFYDWGAFTGYNQTIFRLLTQMEPMNARSLFPCLDEPKYKSIFKMKITVSEKISKRAQVLSNMPLRSKVPNDDGLVTYTYEETPRMSTYLIAVVIAEYKQMAQTEGSLPQVTVWGDESKKAARAVRETIFELERQFQLDEPLAHIKYAFNDKFGAMENWGLVIDTKKTSQKEPSIRMIHETVHYIFGNLVTCDWWDDIWLNEGFTVFYTFKVMDWLPEIVGKKARSVEYVSGWKKSVRFRKTTSNSLVDKTWFISVFPRFVYSVGSMFLFMLEGVFGKINFNYAVKKYLTAHQYQTATSKDFINSLLAVAVERKIPGWIPNNVLDMEEFMNSWLYQAHLPMISIDWDSSANLFRISQSCVNDGHEPCSEKWYIPIWYGVKGFPKFVSKTFWTMPGQPEMHIPLDEATHDFHDISWNPDDKGSYLINVKYITHHDIEDGLYKPSDADIMNYFVFADLLHDDDHERKFCASCQQMETDMEESMMKVICEKRKAHCIF